MSTINDYLMMLNLVTFTVSSASRIISKAD